MTDSLERLLDLACSEPGYGPEFYRTLLQSDVFAMVPAPGHGADDGVIRFVTWTDLDGVRVIPYFSSDALAKRATNPGFETLRINGRMFLEATVGATVVLNPNERAQCRLAPTEVKALLETEAVSSPEAVPIDGGQTMAFECPTVLPNALIHSLTVLYSRHKSVRRAYLVCCSPPTEPKQRGYLVVVVVAAEADGERIARESAAVMQDVPPDLSTDLLTLSDEDSDFLRTMADLTPPFYEQSLGARMVMPSSGKTS